MVYVCKSKFDWFYNTSSHYQDTKYNLDDFFLVIV